MASVKKSDIPDIARFMTDFWELVKKYWIPENADSKYWERQVAEMAEMAEKYGNDKFVKKMLLAYADYLEEKQMRGDGGNG